MSLHGLPLLNEPNPNIEAPPFVDWQHRVGRCRARHDHRVDMSVAVQRGYPLFEPAPWYRRLFRRGVQS